jgi:hypothetical protein
MAAAIFSLLNAKGFEVGSRFIFVTIAAGNYSGAFIALCPNQEDNAVVIPAQTLQALFAIFLALIFYRYHRGIEYTTELSQVNAVSLEVPLSLGFVPDDHALNVVTKNKPVKLFVVTEAQPIHQHGRPAMKPPCAGYVKLQGLPH